jgi:O-antigen ligase
MSTPSATFATPLRRGLAAGSVVALAIVTLVTNGATRMHASPWSMVLAFAQLAPIALLGLRLAGAGGALLLPPRAWRVTAAGAALCELAAALASPFRGVSLLAALTPWSAIACFLLLYDWVADNADRNGPRLQLAAAVFSAAVVAAGALPWLVHVVRDRAWQDLATLAASRNGRPLGHSNYTAGLALLALPWLAAQVRRTRGTARAFWSAAVLLGLVMLVSSGSRAGVLGLGLAVAVAIYHWRLRWRTLAFVSLGGLAFVAAVVWVNPRTRTLLLRQVHAGFHLSESSTQRQAMATAGWRMGRERPLVGWGPGTTALVYPRYRAGLDGGVEDALQLHSTPVQLWADFGVGGILALLAFGVLGVRASWRHRADPLLVPASVSLAGYAVIALFDYQLDVPVFCGALAVSAALLAATATSVVPSPAPRWWLVVVLVGIGLAAALGRRDETPALNVTALSLGRDPSGQPKAIALLTESLRRNPDQEIAHFNLGWLLVVRDPAAAERHFRAAAHLVPDKGGVYFGLALARLNQQPGTGDPTVARALALECLNDPLFLTSPWWREPALAAYRAGTFAALRRYCEDLAPRFERDLDPRAHDARWVAALADWLEGVDRPGEMLALAHTPERVQYFVGRPARPDFAAAPLRSYRRERQAYPILARNLDLPPPLDLFDVQENTLAGGELRFLFPAKGWLPGPVLAGLLDRALSAKP